VVDVLGVDPAHRRVLADDDIRLEAADHPRQLAAQLQVRLQIGVWVLEEEDLLDTEDARRLALLRLAGGHQPLGGHLRVVAPLVSGGEENVDDFVSLVRPARDRSRADELGVVRVGHEDGDLLWAGRLVARVRGVARDLQRLGVDRRRRLARRGVVFPLPVPLRHSRSIPIQTAQTRAWCNTAIVRDDVP
jgi:hypothetical protein